MTEPEMTWERFVAVQEGRARIGRADLTRALREAGVSGYSKLGMDGLRGLVEGTPIARDAVRRVRHERAIIPRWAMRKALGVSYGELADIEDMAGVVTGSASKPSGGKYDVYGSWGDAKRVWDVALGYEPKGTWVHMRATVDGAGASASADALIERMESCGIRVLNVHDYESDGVLMRYFDAVCG